MISSDSGRFTVRVIRTDEELTIARSTARILDLGSNRKT
jgi:acetate kinase